MSITTGTMPKDLEPTGKKPKKPNKKPKAPKKPKVPYDNSIPGLK